MEERNLKNKDSIWIKNGSFAVGGLHEVGFNQNSDYLMVLSSRGRGIFDCIKGEIVGRDHWDYYLEKWDAKTSIVKGFGILEGKDIVCGGFESENVLQQETHDGWEVIINGAKRIDLKTDLLQAGTISLVHEENTQIEDVFDFHYGIDRGLGFSETGNSFVIATTSDLHIWTKKDALLL